MQPGGRAPLATAVLAAALAVGPLGGCGSSPSDPLVALYPDVIAATAVETDDGIWRFDVTISSPYDTPERYADAWRVVGSDGAVYGVRELTHDHQGEQPFTRSLSGVEIPGDVVSVSIEGRDQVSGWGGATIGVALTGR